MDTVQTHELSMDGSKSSQREKIARMSKNRRETIEVQSDDLESDMEAGAKKSSTCAGKGSQDPGVIHHRLTFRADPDLLEPKEKHKKLSRNEIEKLRRDRLNAYFMELAKLVPLVMQTNKKIDKASILRLTVAYLRIYHDLVKGSKRSKLRGNWRPDVTMHENLGNLLLESFGGFLMVINKKGILIFATEAIAKLLGHSLSDVLGSEVRNLIHPNDYEILMQQFEITESDGRIKDTDDETDVAHVPVSGQRSFCVKMLNVLDPQSTCFELVHLVGHLKRMPPVNDNGTPTTPSGSQSSSPSQEPSVCLVAVAKLVSRQPIQDLYPEMENASNQWITRHELDGKITYSDQRGALVTGFLPGESIGFSPYSLLHPDDISSVVAVHNLFLENGCVPLTVFRMFTKSREILYVQTNTHMVIDSWTSKPKFIISINTILEEHDGLLALEDQNCRIEDKKRCIEVVQNTCFSSHTPLSSSSHDPDDSSQSIQDPPSVALSFPDLDCVIPEVEEVDDSTVDIVVGMRKFRIQMTDNPKFDPRSPPHSFSGIGMVFDTHATKDDGGKSIPNVIPSFLSGTSGGCVVSDHFSASASSSVRSCASVTEFPSADVDQEHPSQNGSVPHRCVAADDASSLADEAMPDAGMMMMQNRDDVIQKTGGQHLLLRQLLVDRPQASKGLRKTMMDGERRQARNRILSMESTSKPKDEPACGEFSQIKSLLREGRETTKRSAAGIPNGGTACYSDPDFAHGIGNLPFCHHGVVGHPATSTAMPCGTAVTGNIRRGSACESVAPPPGVPYHQMSGATPSSTYGPAYCSTSGSTFGSTSGSAFGSVFGSTLGPTFGSTSGPTFGTTTTGSTSARNGFAQYLNGDIFNTSQNGTYSGLEAQLRTITSRENYANPSKSCATGVQRNGHASFLPTSGSVVARETDSNSGVIRSSVSKIISRMPSVDKMKFLRHLIAEQEKVYTIDSSMDDPTLEHFNGNGSHEMLTEQQMDCAENGSFQSALAIEPSNAPQTSADAASVNGWCQDFGMASSGGYDLCPTTTTTSSLNCWTSDVFDEFLAQQNDISDWKSLVDDL